jgi:mRNA interferase HigB
MHIISKRRIWEAKKEFPEVANALDGWYRVISKNIFNNFAELKRSFGSIDKVNNLYVFDVGGNKFRLITSIHFNRQKLYIRHILTHTEYDKGLWKR